MFIIFRNAIIMLHISFLKVVPFLSPHFEQKQFTHTQSSQGKVSGGKYPSVSMQNIIDKLDVFFYKCLKILISHLRGFPHGLVIS